MKMQKMKLVILITACLPFMVCLGVTSKITRHSSSQVFLKGEVNDVVISSRGNIQLGRQAEVL
ncbi:MAG: hypothetical protein ABSH16_05450, partial [Sedimentisphaerales bacterium]